MVGASGMAAADTTENDQPIVDADADVAMHDNGDANGDASVDTNNGGGDNGDEDEGILEELLGGIGDDNGDNGEDYSSDDSLLGIL
jgi:hypothetical protein